MKKIAVLAAALMVPFVAAVHGQQAAAVPSFRFERPVQLAGSGAHRLPIDVPLLTAGRPFKVVPGYTTTDSSEERWAAIGGLGDLRLFDPSGREVPYLLVANPPYEPTW